MRGTPTETAARGATALTRYVAWRDGLVARSGFTCRPIPFRESREWSFPDGFLRHRSGGFFSVGGLATRARIPELDAQQQLILLQPETAINGFLWRRRGGHGELLFQGRIEPGNCEALQLAPTVQSTEANYKRLHRGGATAFLEWFTAKDAPVLYDALQSEEATRYYGKYNRNVVVDASAPGELGELDLPAQFRWYGIDDLRDLVLQSNVVNTDARSVLAGLDWRWLAADGAPFAGHPDGSLGARLRQSWTAGPATDDVDDAGVLAWLQRLRVRASVRHTVLPLDALEGWVVGDDTISERERRHGFCVRQFAVHAGGREVAAWDQPLIDSDGVGRIVLAFQERAGVLRVLVRASHEIGFLEGVQVSASLLARPGADASADDAFDADLRALLADQDRCRVLHRCRQSEEGGRFWRDENDYELVELDAAIDLPADPTRRWLTLAQIRRLIDVPGTFSMEFRGALALLLHWV